ncbi:MAG: hypothetical protein ACR2NR_03625 [Solirubrobacteraceae bacterium]
MSAVLQAEVQAVIDGLVASETEIGLQVASCTRAGLVVDELRFGVPRHLLARVAHVGPEGGAPPRPEPGSPLDRAIPPGVQPTAAFANRQDILAADIPSQGTITARAAARMYSALLGHIDGVKPVSPKHLQMIAHRRSPASIG